MKCLQCKDTGFYLKVEYSGLDKVQAPIYRKEIKVVCSCSSGQEYATLYTRV